MPKFRLSILKARHKLQQKLLKETKFKSLLELENLTERYDSVCVHGILDRPHFKEFCFETFLITNDVMLDRIFRTFDADNDNKISLEEWIRGMSIFIRGTDYEQAVFCFEIYDMNQDSMVTRDEMFHLLKHSFVANKHMTDDDPEEGIRDLVDLAVKQIKPDSQDQFIRKEEFVAAVLRDNLVLQFLGPCLPNSRCTEDFEKFVIQRPVKEPFNAFKDILEKLKEKYDET